MFLRGLESIHDCINIGFIERLEKKPGLRVPDKRSQEVPRSVPWRIVGKLAIFHPSSPLGTSSFSGVPLDRLARSLPATSRQALRGSEDQNNLF